MHSRLKRFLEETLQILIEKTSLLRSILCATPKSDQISVCNNKENHKAHTNTV